MKKSQLILFALLLLTTFVSAQTAYFRSIGMPDEIQQTSVTCLYQGESGYLWIGTGKGLYQFDGNDFVPFYGTGKQTQLQVSALYMSPDQVLWIGTRTGEIYTLYGDSIQLFNPEEGNPKVAITGFAADKSGNLWFSTYGEGVYYFNGKHIYNVNTDDGLTDNYCYAITADNHGRIWTATDGGISVCSIEKGGKKVRKITTGEGLPDNIVMSLKIVGTEIWAGMQDAGICKIDLTTFDITVPQASEKWTYGPIKGIVNGKGWVWLSTERNGIISIDSETGNINGVYTSYDNLNISRINLMYADRQGNYWIATPGQLLITLGRDLLQFTGFGSVTGKNIHSLLISREGNIFFSNDEGLFVIGKQNQQTSQIKLPSGIKTHIISLYEDATGYIWAGTFGSGLLCIDPKSKRVKLFGEANGLSNGNILSIAGKEDQIWLATLGGAYYCKFKDDPLEIGSNVKFENYGQQHFYGNNYIYSVFIDSRNRIWFGTDGKGISMLKDGSFTNFDKAQGLKSNIVYSVTEDSDGQIWFSTANAGLYRYDGKSLKNYSLREGLSELHITGLLADKNHHLVIVHNNGIDIMDTHTNAFLYLGKGVGITAINPDLNVCYAEGRDVAWLGTQNGIFRLQIPENILSRQPSLKINRVSVFLGRENFIGTHEFLYNQNHISFHFNAFWFIEPELVRYQVRLKEYDLDWIDTRDNLATYSNLPPGNYTFEMRASIKGNFTTDNIKSYSFTVKKPFWKSTWFIIVSVLAISLLIYLVIHLREKNLKQREAVEREKLMFQLQTLRSQVNPHFLFNSFSTLISIIDEDKEVAIDYVEKLSQFFRNILEYRENDLISLNEELKLIDTYFYLQKKRYNQNLQFEINISAKSRSSLIPPMVLQMLVENSIKHNVISAEKPLIVTIFTDENYITVSNTLQRKKDKEASTGIGITNIRNRYALLGFGEIRISTSDDIFTVQLPLIYSAK